MTSIQDSQLSDELLDILVELDLPKDEYILGGSGPLMLRNIRRVNDVDIFVTTSLWFRVYANQDGWKIYRTDPKDVVRRCDPPFLYKEINGIEVNLFFGWKTRGPMSQLDTASLMSRAEIVLGIPCIPLVELYHLKKAVGRDKDLEDLQLIDRWREENV